MYAFLLLIGAFYLIRPSAFWEKKIHLSLTVSVGSKGLLQTFTPLHGCSNEDHWGPWLSFLKNLLPWLQCTILVLILSPNNSAALVGFAFSSLYPLP